MEINKNDTHIDISSANTAKLSKYLTSVKVIRKNVLMRSSSPQRIVNNLINYYLFHYCIMHQF